MRPNMPADTHLWLKMAIDWSNCCFSLTCIAPPPTSFKHTHLHEHTGRGEVAHTYSHLRAQTLQVVDGGNGVLQHPEV